MLFLVRKGEVMTVDEALSIARNLRYGPLPKPDDPTPRLCEAVSLIHEERRKCGFNWLTGEKAEDILWQEREKR